MTETELRISRIGFPPFSARNCQQKLMPIRSGDFRRTVNGHLVYLGRGTHHKFKSSIFCEDKSAFAFDQLWLGAEVEVSCVQRLWQEEMVDHRPIQLLRPAVESSVLVRDSRHDPLRFTLEDPSMITIHTKSGTNAFINYSPILRMRVTNFIFTVREWSEKSSWHLDLEEI